MEFVSAFYEVDKDHDNVIDEEDLQNYSLRMGYTEKFTRKWLLLFDSNKDGVITLQEFCEALGLKTDEVEEELTAKRGQKNFSSQPIANQIHEIQKEPSFSVIIIDSDCSTEDGGYITDLAIEAIKTHGTASDLMVLFMESRLNEHFKKQWCVLHGSAVDAKTVNFVAGCMVCFSVTQKNVTNKFLVWRKQQKSGCCSFCF